jgi:hypothetical protein
LPLRQASFGTQALYALSDDSRFVHGAFLFLRFHIRKGIVRHWQGALS